MRIGLGYVEQVPEKTADRIVQERAAHGRFRSLTDFVRRVPLRPEALENLVAVGAFDAFGLDRREALWQIGLFVPARAFGGPRAKPAQPPGRQLPLVLPVAQDVVELSPTPEWSQMAADYELLGLSPHHHPLGLLRQHGRLPAGLVTTADLAHLPDGTAVRLAGLVVCRQRPETAKGITFLLLEDEHGLANAIVSRSLYEEQRLLIRAEPFVLLTGRLQRRDRNLNLLATHFERLAGAAQTLDALVAEAATRDHPIDVTAAPSDGGRDHTLRALAPASHNYR